ncbi:hypothetical protein A2982_04070, partial [candidate division WWE3 bacterium RIFCSPLOWO2_01_FULL_39_13]
ELSQEIAFAIKDGKTLEDADRRHAYKRSYIKTPEEIFEEFSDVPEAIENTQKLADKVEIYDIIYNRVQPKFPDLPKGATAEEYLKKEVYSGVKKRYGKMTGELKERVDMELKIIHDKGYDDYFLVVSDMMKWARKHGVLVGVRGSVAGSVASYCLDISDIEPIRWELYFERFLNPERKSPPDIDMDLQDSRREEVINYVIEKYGRKNIAAIAAFGRLKTRAAIRDVCRVMKIDLKTADILSKMVHVKFGRVKPMALMLQDDQDFRKIIEGDPRLIQMADTVSRIEGLCRHVSTHACGYLITPDPITDYVAVQYETGSSEKVITQVEFKPIEDLGLLKFDFLGLINLTIIDYAIKLIKKRHGVDINVYKIPEDDKKTMKLFQDGNTTAVFQFESDGIKRYLRELKPENMQDLCFMAAAYRPGPMQFIPGYIACKQGIKRPEYLIPELEPILKMTYGFAIYQEQVIRIAVDIAGYSMGEADILRRAMGKKIPEVMRAEEDRFVKGCKDKGYSEKIAKQLFEYLKPFADYGFNKSHSAGYAYLAYWTAYLKAHYPIEFMCARMTADMNHPDKLVVALKEARSMGLNLLPPDINKSHLEFSPDGKNEIRYGLDGIKNVGRNIVEELIKERDENGEFTSLNDFCARVGSVNSRTLESLIKVGALNVFGEYNALLSVFPSIISKAGENQKAKDMGQLGLSFQNEAVTGSKPKIEVTKLPDVEPVSAGQKLDWEKDLLGIYFTSHPLQGLIEPLRSKGVVPLSENVLAEGKRVIGLCVVSLIKQIKTKKGDAMAFVTLDDMRSPVEGVLFPKDWQAYRDVINVGDSVVVSGKCNKRNDQISIILDKIKKIEDMPNDLKPDDISSSNVTLIIDESADSNDLEQLRDILVENPGNVVVNLNVTTAGKIRKFKMREKVDSEFISSVVSKLRLVKDVV